jgi:S-layer homology domain
VLPKKYAVIRTTLLASLLGLLTACSGNPNVEKLFDADPQLKQTPNPATSPVVPPNNPTQATLPDDFPDIPRYPNAELIAGEPGNTRWQSSDPSNAIATFYQQQLQSNNWEIVTPFSTTGENGETSLVARKNDLEVKIAIVQSSPNTEYAIAYQQANAASPTPNPTPTPTVATTPTEFSDLETIPEPWRGYVENLAALGVLSANPPQSDRFDPNAIITRREYARWLVTANNQLHANQSNKQIRLASLSDQPVFKDVQRNDADFATIQGLANAGFLPSTLTGDDSAVLFRPDAPLTREDLIAWKVTLDLRKALPTASIDGVKQTWGFQDATKINPKALQALYADYQNGAQANIGRAFGSTTLFQPKKSVSRVEAAAVLWYFGYQGDGISAKEALTAQQAQSQNQTQTQ